MLRKRNHNMKKCRRPVKSDNLQSNAKVTYVCGQRLHGDQCVRAPGPPVPHSTSGGTDLKLPRGDNRWTFSSLSPSLLPLPLVQLEILVSPIPSLRDLR